MENILLDRFLPYVFMHIYENFILNPFQILCRFNQKLFQKSLKDMFIVVTVTRFIDVLLEVYNLM